MPPQGIDICGILGHIEAKPDVAHSPELIDFVGLHLLYNSHQISRISQVAIMQNEVAVFGMRILIQMIDLISIEEGSTPFYAVYFVTFSLQQFREVGSILSSETSNKGAFQESREFVSSKSIVQYGDDSCQNFNNKNFNWPS